MLALTLISERRLGPRSPAGGAASLAAVRAGMVSARGDSPAAGVSFFSASMRARVASSGSAARACRPISLAWCCQAVQVLCS